MPFSPNTAQSGPVSSFGFFGVPLAFRQCNIIERQNDLRHRQDASGAPILNRDKAPVPGIAQRGRPPTATSCLD